MKLKVVLKGGSGSGNYGHSGRPGLIGGSASNNFALGLLKVLSDNVSVIQKANGSIIKLQGYNAKGLFETACQDLPEKAVDIIRNMKHDISFFVSERHNMTGEYIWTGANHKISVGSDYDAEIYMEEFAHMLDKELGKNAEYSRSKRWQDIMRKERSNFSAMYNTGKSTEEFARTFLLYTLYKYKLEKYPLRLAVMEELFG